LYSLFLVCRSSSEAERERETEGVSEGERGDKERGDLGLIATASFAVVFGRYQN